MQRVRQGAMGMAALQLQKAPYRIMPHVYNEHEELADVQKNKRWFITHRDIYGTPPIKAELMTEKLNLREGRRRGIMPERSIARKFSQVYAVDGEVSTPPVKAKMLTITVIGMDGHPYYFRVPPMPDTTLNTLIDGTGIMIGYPMAFQQCRNVECADLNHGDGCMVNVDIDTLDKLLPPTRNEFHSLNFFRELGYSAVQYNTRFSCQLFLTEDLDGGIFAMKQPFARGLYESTQGWNQLDTQATLAMRGSRRIEPWAPPLEEPTKADFPLTMDLIWEDDPETLLQRKYPKYRRKDGFHTKPRYWDQYIDN